MISTAEAARRLKMPLRTVQRWARGISHDYRIARDRLGRQQEQLFVAWQQLQELVQQRNSAEWRANMIPAAVAARRLKVSLALIHQLARAGRVEFSYAKVPDRRQRLFPQLLVSWPDLRDYFRSRAQTEQWGDMIPAVEVASRLSISVTTVHKWASRVTHERRKVRNRRGQRQEQLLICWPEFRQWWQTRQRQKEQSDVMPAVEAARRLGISRSAVGAWARAASAQRGYQDACDKRGVVQRQLMVSLPELTDWKRNRVQPQDWGDMIPASVATRRLGVSRRKVGQLALQVRHDFRTAADSRGRRHQQLFLSWSELQELLGNAGPAAPEARQPAAGEPEVVLGDQGERSAGNGDNRGSIQKQPKAAKKGGRPAYWNHAVIEFRKARRGNPKLKRPAFLRQYAKSFSDRPCPTAKQLRQAESYRR